MAKASPADLRTRLRDLPSVAAVLERPEVAALIDAHGRKAVTRATRAALDEARRAIRAGEGRPAGLPTAEVEAGLRDRSSLAPVINATGVIVHTNLGRAPLAEEALGAAQEVAQGYCTLEYDAAAGRRGDRHHHATDLLRTLTGAEDAAVVNNNAGAVLLTLAAVAGGREVIVSRGELVEIGGGFRVPDVMAQSGCRLVEVGTTNRTWPRDYEGAFTEDTGALLKVHRSNFAIVGFTAEVDVAGLAAIGKERGVPVLVDAGSGCLLANDYTPNEEPVARLLEAGADLVMVSGDKLLGGPQAGLVVGRADLVAAVRRHPLMRALRPDKLALASLVATLRLWRDRPEAVPVWRMLNAPLGELRGRAERLVVELQQAGVVAAVRETEATIGGGTAPSAVRPSAAVALAGPARAVEAWAEQLRSREPAVVARIERGELLLDLCAVAPDEDVLLRRALVELTEPAGGAGHG